MEATVVEGKYPLFDLYRKHGRIVFQLYAACRGCDFTEHATGIPYLGFEKIVLLLENLEGRPSASKLASVIWREYQNIAEGAGLDTKEELRQHLQRIVDIFSTGKIYDPESNIVDLNGRIIKKATVESLQYMRGQANCQTLEAHMKELRQAIVAMDCAHLLH